MEQLLAGLIGIISIVGTPAAAIHIAYQVWYFKNYMIKDGPEEKQQ